MITLLCGIGGVNNNFINIDLLNSSCEEAHDACLVFLFVKMISGFRYLADGTIQKVFIRLFI